MRKRARVLWGLCGLWLGLVAFAPAVSALEDPSGTPDSSLSVIQVGDKISIQVYLEKDLSGSFTVDAQGNINYYFLGDVHVEGLTIDELRAFLVDALSKDYLVNPQVQIAFEESPTKSVSILGQVVRPGNYLLARNDTLIKLVSQVGGFTADASQVVKLLRTNRDGTKKYFELDVAKITRGQSPDFDLRPADVIFVEKKEEEKISKTVVSILGQVVHPGNYSFVPEMTIVRLISEAGGFTALAVPNKVKIIHHPESSIETVTVVNVAAMLDGKTKDIPLQEGDVVVVSESFF